MSDQSIRGQLAGIVSRNLDFIASDPDVIADAVLKAGWRPPARVITEPADLDLLPVDTLIQEQEGQRRAWQLSRFDRVGYYLRPWWTTTGDDMARTSDAIDLPATVLHTPENGDTP